MDSEWPQKEQRYGREQLVLARRDIAGPRRTMGDAVCMTTKTEEFMLTAQEDPDPTTPTTALGRKWWVVGNNRTRSPRFEVCDGQRTAT